MKDTLDALLQSKVFVQLIGGINDTQTQITTLQHEVNALETAIKTDIDNEINNGKRVEESIILRNVLEKQFISVEDLIKLIFKKYGYD